MRILGLDFETAGTRQSGAFRAVEVGFAVVDMETKRLQSASGYLLNDLLKEPTFSKDLIENYHDISEEAQAIHKIDKLQVLNYGKQPATFFVDLISQNLFTIDAIMVWNGYFFDRPLLFELIERCFHSRSLPAEAYEHEKQKIASIPWIDLKLDLNFKHKLDHEAADRGILSAYPHAAIADVITMLRLFTSLDVDVKELIKRAKSEFVIAKAITKFEQREQVKGQNFRWQPNMKCWWKIARQVDFDKESKNWTFDTEIFAATPEQCDKFFAF